MKEIKAKKVGCIVATTLDGYIGYQNELMIDALMPRLIDPERIAAQQARKMDIEYFAEVTKGKDVRTSVIMGRRTWESLPGKFKPLPDRINIVITSKLNYRVPEGVLTFSSIDEALEEVDVDEAWLIGGAGIYDEASRFAGEVHICQYQFEVNRIFHPHELRSGAVQVPDWMKDPTQFGYEKARDIVPDSWQRYEIKIYRYVDKT